MRNALTNGVASRRNVLIALGLGGAAALATACTPAAPVVAPTNAPAAAPAGSASPSPSAVAASNQALPAAASPKFGGTLRYGIVGDLTNLEGHNSGAVADNTLSQVWDKLVSYDEKSAVQGELAESWDLSADSRQVKLNLRRGVQYHSGRTFTSADVRYNFARVVDPKNLKDVGKFALQGAWFNTIETPDQNTIILKSDEPRPGVWDFLTYFNMVDRESLENPPERRTAVGTGPFSLAEYVQADHITFLKNPNYWRNKQPYLDGFRVSILADNQAQAVQLEAGALDLIDAPQLVDVARLSKDPKYQVVADYTLGQFWYALCNTTYQPLDNKKVRQALNFAMDRKRFTETVMMGFAGPPQALPWPASSPAFEAQKNAAYSFDLDKARSLLNEAGVKDLKLDLIYKSRQEDFGRFAQIYQADLAKIGVVGTVKGLDNSAVSELTNKRSYQGIQFVIGSKTHLMEAATGAAQTSSLNPQSNTSGFESARYSQFFDDAGTEPDPVKRKQIYSQLNDFLLDESFTMTLSLASSTGVATSKVQNLKWDKIPRYALREAWLA